MSKEEIKEKAPTIFKKIGGITYRVKVHFSKEATEDMQQKIERMLREEVKAEKSKSGKC